MKLKSGREGSPVYGEGLYGFFSRTKKKKRPEASSVSGEKLRRGTGKDQTRKDDLVSLACRREKKRAQDVNAPRNAATA